MDRHWGFGVSRNARRGSIHVPARTSRHRRLHAAPPSERPRRLGDVAGRPDRGRGGDGRGRDPGGRADRREADARLLLGGAYGLRDAGSLYDERAGHPGRAVLGRGDGLPVAAARRRRGHRMGPGRHLLHGLGLAVGRHRPDRLRRRGHRPGRQRAAPAAGGPASTPSTSAITTPNGACRSGTGARSTRS